MVTDPLFDITKEFVILLGVQKSRDTHDWHEDEL